MNFSSVNERAYMSPSSSPASSLDSSPDPFYSHQQDSSPIMEPLDLDDDAMEEDTARPMDPYAGARHGRPPRMYERKPPLVSTPLLPPPALPAFNIVPLNAKSAFEDLFDEEERAPQALVSDEERIWKDAVDKAVDEGEQFVDLSHRSLTYIADCVSELESIVSVSGAHADGVRSHRTFSRAQSAALFGSATGPALNLSQNAIRALPPALFVLRNLTFLSLRNNVLEFIPPQISELRSLSVLNVAFNQLTFLPAEICTLPLTHLTVHPNPFLPDPSSNISPDQPRPCLPWRAIGLTVVKSTIPSLSETIMRHLMSPFQPSTPSKPVPPPSLRSPHNSPMRQRALANSTTLSNLRARFSLPLTDAHDVPEPYVRMLAHAERGSVSRPLSRAPTRDSDVFSSPRSSTGPDAAFSRTVSTATWNSDRTLVEESEPGLSRCPSPRHLPEGAIDPGPEGDWAHRGPPYFTLVEERFVWVDTVRGIKIGEVTGGVPLLWRGCERGCLDFLGAPWPEVSQQDKDVDMS